MSKLTNHWDISLFFCRAYFPPVYWARHKTHVEPKVGRSQNGPASNRENLRQSSFTLASAILDGIKGLDGFCSETRPATAVAAARVAVRSSSTAHRIFATIAAHSPCLRPAWLRRVAVWHSSRQRIAARLHRLDRRSRRRCRRATTLASAALVRHASFGLPARQSCGALMREAQ